VTAAPASFELDRGEAERLTGGRWNGVVDRVVVRGAAIDSRRIAPGCMFACLRGRHVDGHDFASTAVGDGAALVLADRVLDVPVPVLVVDDVARAFSILAAEHRRRLEDVTWIAISGANGKTTVKELLAAACAVQGQTHATAGNLNNLLGVPLTVFALPAGTRYAIVELGGDHVGEIDRLAAIVRPHLACMTSLGPCHLEGYGDLRGVARGEAAVFTHVPEGAPVFFGGHGLEEIAEEDRGDCLAAVRAAAAGRALRVVGDEVDGSCDDRGVHLATPHGVVNCPLLGAHNLANLALAYACARAAGVPGARAARGLAGAGPVAGRLAPRRFGAHRVLDDAYNANPASVAAGLRELARREGRRVAVLGHMGELGAESEQLHRDSGALAAGLGLTLVAVGDDAAAIAAGYRASGGQDCRVADGCEEAARQLVDLGDTQPLQVLIKASRAAGLDRLVAALAERWQPDAARAAPC